MERHNRASQKAAHSGVKYTAYGGAHSVCLSRSVVKRLSQERGQGRPTLHPMRPVWVTWSFTMDGPAVTLLRPCRLASTRKRSSLGCHSPEPPPMGGAGYNSDGGQNHFLEMQAGILDDI